jgi:hypothetical protein
MTVDRYWKWRIVAFLVQVQKTWELELLEKKAQGM